tara:strand:- start:363635 stop:364552 length:918 start_codon:yes stop_codon:yes gene_type:complete
MATYELFKRLEILIDLLQRYPNISKKNILRRLADDYGIHKASRTIERDFRSLEIEFGINITYNHQVKGYEIDTDSQNRVQSLLKFVELVHVGEIFKQGLEDFDELRDIIDLDDSSNFRGIDNLKNILIAIKKNQEIIFEHENYYRETSKQYTVTPMRIKEYLNRWYVIGVPKGHQEIRTFGIDRITNLEIGIVSKIKQKSFEKQLDQFLNVVGLTYGDVTSKPERVVLKVDSNQLKYLDSLPLHFTQEIDHESNENFALVFYRIIPNYEFKIEVLKMNSSVEVLEPNWLREEIKNMLKESLANYK